MDSNLDQQSGGVGLGRSRNAVRLSSGRSQFAASAFCVAFTTVCLAILYLQDSHARLRTEDIQYLLVGGIFLGVPGVAALGLVSTLAAPGWRKLAAWSCAVAWAVSSSLAGWLALSEDSRRRLASPDVCSTCRFADGHRCSWCGSALAVMRLA